ncbi:MAG: FHA domain-containing protein [bacterium]|nr:FHA domain-containing protein [bacterium]
MTPITLRVLDGADRGRVFENLTAPVTIGREEGNSIQLNDERVSRYHVKIQEDHANLVLTDLESTNGTKVNGEDIQLRILRYGDMVTVGRSVLLYGSRDQIADRLARLRGEDPDSNSDQADLEFGANWSPDSSYHETIQTLHPPELPDRLSPGQAAELSELLEYFHIRIRHLAGSVEIDRKSERVTLDARQWQNVIDIQARLAEYLRNIGDPNPPEV